MSKIEWTDGGEMKRLTKERLEEIKEHTRELASIGAVGFLTIDSPGVASQSSVHEAIELIDHITSLEAELSSLREVAEAAELYADERCTEEGCKWTVKCGSFNGLLCKHQLIMALAALKKPKYKER